MISTRISMAGRMMAVLLALVTWSSALAAQSATTIFVVRHAERASQEGDSPLSEVGEARAARLATILRDAGITHAFSSEFQRTRSTVAPVAQQAGVTPTTVPARDLPALLAMLRTLPAGSRAVVAGHSNTINRIAGGLSNQQIADLPETEYDRLYVVTISGTDVSVVLLRYE